MSLSVGVLGAGYFAAFQHEAWTRVTGARLLAVADADPDRAAQAARAVGDVAALPSLSALLDRAPDIVDLCIPPEGHAAAIRAALAARPRAIICQKPFCLTIDEAEAIVAEAEAAGVPLVIHENFRFQPWWRAIRAAIDAGRIGTPFTATFRLRTGDGRGPRAYLDRQPYFQTMERLLIHETGVHYIDTFRYLLGEPVAVYADLRRLNPAIRAEDAGFLLMEHAGGARSLFDGNRLVDHPAPSPRHTFGEALVEGSDGVLDLRGDGSVRARAIGAREAEVILPASPPRGFAGDCVHALQSHVVAHLVDGAPLENTARDYLTVLRAKDAAYLSARTGRRIALR